MGCGSSPVAWDFPWWHRAGFGAGGLGAGIPRPSCLHVPDSPPVSIETGWISKKYTVNRDPWKELTACGREGCGNRYHIYIHSTAIFVCACEIYPILCASSYPRNTHFFPALNVFSMKPQIFKEGKTLYLQGCFPAESQVLSDKCITKKPFIPVHQAFLCSHSALLLLRSWHFDNVQVRYLNTKTSFSTRSCSTTYKPPWWPTETAPSRRVRSCLLPSFRSQPP